MLLNLEEPSVIVMDNASYHSSLVENYPKSNSRTVDVQQWLRDENKDFSPVETLDGLQGKSETFDAARKKIYTRRTTNFPNGS